MKKAKAKKSGTASSSAKKDDTTTSPAPASPSLVEPTPAAPEAAAEDDVPATTTTAAQQSKARSTSFRQGSISIPHPGAAVVGSPFSPEGETAPDIYRKHVTRIEELERENKRLGREASEAEKRWEKAEEELADWREKEGGGGGDGGVVEGLVSSSFLLAGAG